MNMNLKQQAARAALKHVHSGMRIGLGTGSTTAHFIDLLGEQLSSGALHDIAGVPTSERTAAQALSRQIPLTTLGQVDWLDLAVDGADEVDPDLNLIKGLGRALLREKIVESHTDNLIIVADDSKLVPRLGTTVPLPVEILPFEWAAHVRWLGSLGCRADLRLEEDGSPVTTDNGNYMALCHFPDGIADPKALARALADRPGIIEHGLFLGMARQAIIAGRNGTIVLE